MAAALLGTLWAYSPVREAGYVYEDDVYVSPATLDLPASYYVRPRGLTALSFRLNPWLAGSAEPSGPREYHAVNVLLHLLMGLGVYGLARTVAGDDRLAAAGGALFLLHPLASESVAYIAGRAEIIAGLGTVGAVWLAASGPMTVARTLGVLLAVVVAVGGKETGLMALPLVGFVLLWQGRCHWTWKTWAAVGGLSVLFVGLLAGIALDRMIGNDYLASSERKLIGTAAMQAWAFWHYLVLMVWPVGLSVDHDFETISRLGAVISLGLLVSVMVACLACWRRYPPLPFVAGWIAIVLCPRFVVPISELLNEHQLYVSLVGFCLVLPVLAADVAQRLFGRQGSAPPCDVLPSS